MEYEKTEWRKSQIHMLTIDLTKEEVRPVVGGDQFPFLRTYPLEKAIDQGAIASVGGGYNTTLFHMFVDRVPDEPLHAMVLDHEIWTTGVGAGGAGLLLGDQFAATRERNQISVNLWQREPSRAYNVESINHGHAGKLVAFTPRGGDNEMPGWKVVWGASGRTLKQVQSKNYVLLQEAATWEHRFAKSRRQMHVIAIAKGDSPPPLFSSSSDVILEMDASLGIPPFQLGEMLTWNQRLATTPGIHSIISGWPQIVRDGKNAVPALDLHGVASHGPDNWFIRKNPRMCIGASEDGRTVYIVTVEGRIDWSVGLRLKELATWLINQGVWSAVNFDGGGSAFMWLLIQGLVARGCYNYTRPPNISGLRPDHVAIAVFNR